MREPHVNDIVHRIRTEEAPWGTPGPKERRRLFTGTEAMAQSVAGEAGQAGEQGEAGEAGEAGADGPTGPTGDTGFGFTDASVGGTDTLPAGTPATANVTPIPGLNGSLVFEFGIPQGDTGETGETGFAFDNAYALATTLAPGEPATASVVPSGTTLDFSFGIPKGDTGADSIVPGPTGPTGPTGSGVTGTTGPAGPTGPAGKSAIVPTSKGPVAIFCVESPEVWIPDTQTFVISGGQSIPISPLMLEVCEADSFVVSAIVPSLAVMVGADIKDNHIVFDTTTTNLRVTVTIQGIRKGFSGVRFPSRTVEQMELNNAHWRTLSAS